MNNQMMAAVLYGKEHIQVEPVAIPKIESGDILVRVKAALTCGTDVKVFRRGYHARMIVPPAVFGHELAGDVVAANSAPCNNCFFCKRGLENLCEDLLFNNGAYAEYIKIPSRIVETNMLALPDGVSFESAAIWRISIEAAMISSEQKRDKGDSHAFAEPPDARRFEPCDPVALWLGAQRQDFRLVLRSKP